MQNEGEIDVSFEKHWVHILVFHFFPVLYFLALFYSLFYTYGIHWAWAGLLIGMIYIGPSIITFRQKHFYGYISKGESANHLKLIISIVLCSFLNLTLQCFILLGFWMTVDAPKLRENIFIHPHSYGRVYKHTNTVLSQMDTAYDAEYDEDENVLDSYRNKRNAFLVEYCSPYLKINAEDQKSATQLANEIEQEIFKIPFYIAIAFGFLGALIYTLIDLRNHLLKGTLEPSCTARYLIRFIVAPTLSIVFAYFISSDWWTDAAPLAFFCIGYFPDEALDRIVKKLRE